ncbi:ABC transporter ATP-binding protein [Chitinophaga qingshengii]|uniref:ABC transporter ATP-binding protein n=1 Tax=Chitinophaga qingshengii TaxID=1569794 RepID=A0ABR7TQI8_9BACT|nr:ABC transporter ATP-binding protein [Chitinophaga qingshengii]MBC9932749.1 ABC transporter ATP-binding protein [Chitinophaga qingshengii]
MTTNPIIELDRLTKSYGTKKAVDHLSLKVNKGEIFGLLGPNGAGKTTTILMMLGLAEPTSGQAVVCGINATRNPVGVRRKVGYLPDSAGFYDNLTALDNLMYVGRLNGIPEKDIRSRARNTMEMVGLGAEMHKKTGAYSRGMKQRLGLADLLIREPEVMILDEPTLGIDPAGIREFLMLIRQLSRQQELTVLLSSHHLHQMQQICDRVGIFVEGKLLAEGNLETLAGNLFGKDSFVVQVSLREPLTAPVEIERQLLALPGVNKVSITEGNVDMSCSTDITPDIVRFFVRSGLNVTGVHKKEYGLDEIYHRFFEQNTKKYILNEQAV